MLAIIVAKTSGDAIESRSIYDLTIEMNDLPYLDAKTEYIHSGISVVDILNPNADYILTDEANTLGALTAKLTKLEISAIASGFPIVFKDGNGLRSFAFISAKELAVGLATYSYRDENTPVTFSSVMLENNLDPTTPGVCE